MKLGLDFGGPRDSSLHTHELAERHGLEISDLADLRQVVDSNKIIAG